MNLTEAKTHVQELAADVPDFTDHGPRALRLLDKPDLTQQSTFGVCGMSAVLRSLLAAEDKARFAALLDAVFRGRPFRGIPADRLLAGRRRQWQRKVDHSGELGVQAPGARYELDFILARALGKLLKVSSPQIYAEQLMTSANIAVNFPARPDAAPVDLFDLPEDCAAALDGGTVDEHVVTALRAGGDRSAYLCGFGIDPADARVEIVEQGARWCIVLAGPARRRLIVTRADGRLPVAYHAYGEDPAQGAEGDLVYQSAVNRFAIYQKDGDLALDPTGLATIMTDVVGAQSCVYTPLAGAASVGAAVDTVNAQFGLASPYVYAFVNGVNGWFAARDLRDLQHDDPFKQFPEPAAQIPGRSIPVGLHIVAVTGPIQMTRKHYEVPIWTWGTAFTARIPHEHLTGYLAGCTHGRL